MTRYTSLAQARSVRTRFTRGRRRGTQRLDAASCLLYYRRVFNFEATRGEAYCTFGAGGRADIRSASRSLALIRRPLEGLFYCLELAIDEKKRRRVAIMAKDMTGAEIVVEALKDQGVEMVFGYPGGAVLPIYDAIFHQNKLRHILVRHEQGAGHAAEGYARSTGKVGVLLVTSGPGATNAITALTDALMDSIPLV